MPHVRLFIGDPDLPLGMLDRVSWS